MVSNKRRANPYKGFNFRAVIGGALAALAGLGIVKKLLPGASASKPRKRTKEVEAGARPIEGVGTSTAAFVGTAPKRAKKRPSTASRGRKGARTKGPAKNKRR